MIKTRDFDARITLTDLYSETLLQNRKQKYFNIILANRPAT